MAQLVLGEDLCSRLDPFVETFEQRDGKRVAQRPTLGLVIDRVAGELLCHGVFVEIIVRRCLISLVDAAVVVEGDGMDEAGDRYVLVLEP